MITLLVGHFFMIRRRTTPTPASSISQTRSASAG
ncbi:MAG: hypothetical protein M1598_03225 [Actinobacteria bacterium]|nr:hypothetical protein [Actinomycetota bacterium]